MSGMVGHSIVPFDLEEDFPDKHEDLRLLRLPR
jgi:hypothetical protein